MVEIMDMKSKLLEALNPAKTITAAQSLLAKKLLELISVYFRIIEAYVSAKNDSRPGGARMKGFEKGGARMQGSDQEGAYMQGFDGAYLREFEKEGAHMNGFEGAHLQAFEEMGERIKKVYSLIKDLNTKFYLCTNELTGVSAYDEIVHEAEALRNVINENYGK